MEVIRIHGPSSLEGSVHIQGSKNAVLPMMAASVMNGGRTVLENCPDISDIRNSLDILRSIGCTADYENHTLTIDSSGEIKGYIPSELMGRLRSSFLFTGAVLARCPKVKVSLPGGCKIGTRPVDIHLDAFRKLGIEVKENGCEIECSYEKIVPCDINLRFPSVGATENIMIFCARKSGTFRIINAACEPEIRDLENMLNASGARIIGAGTPVIRIEGAGNLKDTRYKVMPDRIVAATYLTAAACCGKEIELCGADANHLSTYIALLRKCGMKICISGDRITAFRKGRLIGSVVARTMPYPGFATDMQSLVMTTMALTDGVGIIQENIFEDRFHLAKTLFDMGADITISGKIASIRGVNKLRGIKADASDLRSGAALAVAMLSAEGESELGNIEYIDRGYEDFSKNLISLGANMERIETN